MEIWLLLIICQCIWFWIIYLNVKRYSIVGLLNVMGCKKYWIMRSGGSHEVLIFTALVYYFHATVCLVMYV